MAGKNAPVLHAEFVVLLMKDAIEPVPPAKLGFHSPYFIIPKKDSGLWLILVLWVARH